MQLRAVEQADAGHLQRTWHKSTDTRGNEHGARQILLVCCGREQPATIFLACHGLDLLPEVHLRAKGRDLLQQALRQRAARSGGYCRNVVNGFIGVELCALAARMGKRVDHMGLDLEQSQLENLEQAYRACTNDNGICFNCGG